MATTIGTAYVQILPSTEGISSALSEAMNGPAESAGAAAGKKAGSGFGSALAGAAKVGAAAIAAGATAVAGLAKEAVNAYANFEQLSGGIETLFGDVAGEAMENASRAFETAGLSANEYMETVTGFAAALKSGLGEDYAWQMANVADLAVIDMADNANKMGSSMESIQNAYQGFAKQNFTMLDNLKLGYGGTKEEMQRLMHDAEELEGYVEGTFDLNNFADVVEAIHIVQENMGIAGTTAKEAATTISGSMSMMQSSWQNVLSAIGQGDMSLISESIGQLVASAQTFAENVMPIIQNALGGIGQLIAELAPQLASMIPELLQQVLPSLLTAGVSIIQTLGEGILNALPELMPTITDLVVQLAGMLVEMLPQLIEVGMQVILQLALGIAEALPELIPTVVDVVLQIVDSLVENADLLIDASVALIMGLADGLIQALPTLIEKAPEIVTKLMQAIIENAPKLLESAVELIGKLVAGIGENLPKILDAGVEIIFTIVEGIAKTLGDLVMKGKEIVDKVKEGFKQKIEDAKNWGKDLIQNFINGIKQKWENLKSSISNIASTVKSFLGFSEPDEGPLSDFHTYAPDMMKLFAKGITDNQGLVTGAVERAFNFSDLIASPRLAPQLAPAGGPASGDVTELRAMRDELRGMLDAMRGMRVVLDSGEVVGALSGPLNSSLGRQYVYDGRGI